MLAFMAEMDQRSLKMVLRFIVRGDLRSRLLVSERLQRDCLDTHNGGKCSCDEDRWLLGSVKNINGYGLNV